MYAHSFFAVTIEMASSCFGQHFQTIKNMNNTENFDLTEKMIVPNY